MGDRGYCALRLRASVVLVVVLVGALGTGASAQAATLSWSGPLAIDHHPPFALTAQFDGISCPDSGHCAAVASDRTDVSKQPTGDYTAWHRVGPGATSVSCPSTDLCIATAANAIVYSTKPFSGAAWSTSPIADQGLTSISCPTTSLCVATDYYGDVLTSSTPTVGSSWQRASIVPGGGLGSISCPTTGFCAAVDNAGDVLTSTDPTGGASAWSSRQVDAKGLDTISCPSSGLCVAAGDYDSQIATSTDPTGGASAWTLGSPGSFRNPFYVYAIDCASTSLCVLVSDGMVVSTTDPAGGASTWHVTDVPDEQGSMQAVSCPTTHFCAAADTLGGVPGYNPAYSGGDVLTTTTPTTRAWAIQPVDGDNLPHSVSCSDPTFCIIGDNAGNVLTSGNPGGGASAWGFDHIDAALAAGITGSGIPATVTGVACHSTGGCVAGDNTGDILSTSDPAGGASTWNVFNNVDNPPTAFYTSFFGAACPSGSECLINDTNNNFAVVDPAATTTPVLTSFGRPLYDLSCPSTSLCVGVGSGGHIVTSTNPAGGPSAWHTTTIDLYQLTGVSCPTANLCVAVDAAGNALRTTTPLSGGWHGAKIDGTTRLYGISCPSVNLCVAFDQGGNALATTTPIGAASSWSSTPVDPSRPIYGLSCSAAPICVAISIDGVFVGVPAAGSGPASVQPGSARTFSGAHAPATGRPAGSGAQRLAARAQARAAREARAARRTRALASRRR